MWENTPPFGAFGLTSKCLKSGGYLRSPKAEIPWRSVSWPASTFCARDDMRAAAPRRSVSRRVCSSALVIEAFASCPRPRRRRAGEQRDEVASFQLVELHSVPASQGRTAGYRMVGVQSGGTGDQSKAPPADWLWLGWPTSLHQPRVGQASIIAWTIAPACRIADGRGGP